MPRHERLNFRDAIHYAQVRGRNGSDIFFDPHTLRRFPQAPRQYAPHALRFELLLAEACTECGTILHGYCLEPNSGILVLQTAGASLQALMQRLLNRYSRYRRAAGFVGGRRVFGARYGSKDVAPEHLPHGVRAAHPAASPAPEQIIAAVARLRNRPPADIYSATPVGVRGRALVAWYGLRSG